VITHELSEFWRALETGSIKKPAIMADVDDDNLTYKANGGLENDLWGGEDEDEHPKAEAAPSVNGAAKGHGDSGVVAEDVEQGVAEADSDADADMDMFGEYVSLLRAPVMRAEPNSRVGAAAGRLGRMGRKIADR
jgi:hypothetical protein